MRTACLMAMLLAAPPAVLAADLPQGDCRRPAARTDLSACDLSRAKLAGKDLRMSKDEPDVFVPIACLGQQFRCGFRLA